MAAEFDYESIDREIARVSETATLAPQGFIESELRRKANKYLIDFREVELPERFLEDYLPILELEYLCYFRREIVIPILEEADGLEAAEAHHALGAAFSQLGLEGVKRQRKEVIYAGCNSQIEEFLWESDLPPDWMSQIGFSSGVNLTEVFPDKLGQFLIMSGYLFPTNGEGLVVHPNMIFAQFSDPIHGGSDSTFLSRDLIRGPYHAVRKSGDIQLSNEETWGYWCDLVTLAAGRVPSQMIYRASNFKEPLGRKVEFTEALDSGKLWIPRRYLDLEPKVEDFEWVLDLP